MSATAVDVDSRDDSPVCHNRSSNDFPRTYGKVNAPGCGRRDRILNTS